jgi:tetratricopeptide (TPR) repeat protein
MAKVINLIDVREQRFADLVDRIYESADAFQARVDAINVKHAEITAQNIKRTSEMLVRDPDNIELLLELAIELPLDSEEDGQKSIAVYERILQLDSKNVKALIDLGGIYHHVFEDLEKAETCFLMSLAIEPKNVCAFNELCDIHVCRGDFEKAESLYLHAIELTGNLRLRKELAQMYFSTRRYEESLAVLKENKSELKQQERMDALEYVSVCIDIANCYQAMAQPLLARLEIGALANDSSEDIRAAIKLKVACVRWCEIVL